MLHLILIRHADAARGITTPQAPAPDHGLTPLGREQARWLGRRLNEEGVLGRCHVLISSPAPRAVETANILAAAYSGRREVDASVSEIGELPEGVAEDIDAAVRRVRGALEHLAQDHDGNMVIVVTHAGFIMASIRALFAIPTPGTGTRLESSNASTTEWTHDAGVWRLLCYNVPPVSA